MQDSEIIPLKEFLESYGFDVSILSDKEKIKILKNIYFNASIEKDLEELKFSKKPEPRNDEDIREYMSNISNLDVDQRNAQIHILMIKEICKENRKLKRKKSLQKLFGKK